MIIIPIFNKMLNGENLTRTLKVDLFEYFLSQILIDYGPIKLESALSSLRLHIEYVATKGDSKIKLKEVCKTYENKLEFHLELDQTYLQLPLKALEILCGEIKANA